MNNFNKIYKYYPISKNSLDAFSQNYFYASSFLTLNDLFEFDKLLIDFTSDILKSDIDLINLNFKFGVDFNNKEELYTFLYQIFFSFNGVFSCSNEFSNKKLWSHYSKNEGFCIEINCSELTMVENEQELNKIESITYINL